MNTLLLHSHWLWFFSSQLQFSNTVAASVLNRATRVGPPSPIIIEKLIPRPERQDDLESCSSSVRLSVLSEERLQAAVRLARRDLRRKHQESISCMSPEPAERSQNISPERSNIDHSPHAVHPKMSGPKKQLKNGAQVLVYTPHQPNSQLKQSQPPTKVLDPRVNSGEPQLTQEIRKLQKELSTYVQRIEQLANKGILINSEHLYYVLFYFYFFLHFLRDVHVGFLQVVLWRFRSLRRNKGWRSGDRSKQPVLHASSMCYSSRSVSSTAVHRHKK